MVQGRASDLIAYITSQGWTWEWGKPIPHGQQFVITAGRQRATVTYYPSSDKMVVGGPASPLRDALAAWVATGPRAPAAAPDRALPVLPLPHIGMDEAGKGDCFGPLVVAAVCLDVPTAAVLSNAGVRDSKTLPAPVIRRLAATIAQHVPASLRHVWVMMPETYNELYTAHGNVNLVLADAYAQVASQVLPNAATDVIVCDQFSARADRLESAFAARGLPRPWQEPRAEAASIAVAAASVLASAAFRTALDDLGHAAGVGRSLPAGASDTVVLRAITRQIIHEQGHNALRRYGKLHFTFFQEVTKE